METKESKERNVAYAATKEKEELLFKVAKRVLQWAEVEYEDEELADLVMFELLDY